MNIASKTELRKKMLKIREQISPERRQQANEEAVNQLEKILPSGIILSYIPFRSELDISVLNIFLASSNRLALPKVQDGKIDIYLVTNTNNQLTPSSWGILEPLPQQCKKIDENEISAVLVPGLAFDTQNYRLGYGKGYYDLLLPKMQNAITLGIGFLEQKVEYLPIDPWDHPLQQIMLF